MKKYLKYLWVALDTLLIFAIFILLGAVVIVPEVSYESSRKINKPQDFKLRGSSVRSDSDIRSVVIAPVAYERTRSAQIAKSMVISESVKLPVRPAMDMREKDETYEVRFALPRGTDDRNVNVKVDGNILTLVMQSANRAYMRRIRIPCDYLHNVQLNHFVSNHVLYVEISHSEVLDQQTL